MKNESTFILYGAIDLGTGIIERVIDYLEKSLGGVVVCFVDDDPVKQIDNNYPRPVFSRSIVKQYPDATIVILSSNVSIIERLVIDDGVNNKIVVFPMLGWGFPCDSEENICRTDTWIRKYDEKCRRLYELTDKETAYIYEKIVYQRKMRKIELLRPREMYNLQGRPYFYDNLRPKGEVTLVDCGAYDGDSILQIYGMFKGDLQRIYAFEPDVTAFAHLKENLLRYNLDNQSSIFNYGVSDDNRVEQWRSSGVDSSICKDGDIEIEVRSLDSMIKIIDGKLVIKMDIEGSEKAALTGATRIIKEYSPYMAICVYHKVADLYDVPYIIKSINPNYKFYLRSGSHTECYAIPV